MRIPFLRTITAVALAATIAGCSNDSTGPTPTGTARFIHAVDFVGPLQFQVVGTGSVRLSYLGNSGYFQVPAATVVVRVSGFLGTLDFVTAFQPDVEQSFVTVGNAIDVQALLLSENPPAPPAGQALVRAVAGIQGLPAVDFYIVPPGETIVGKTPAISNVEFATASTFVTNPAGTFDLVIALTGTDAEIFRSGSGVLADQSAQTVILAGSSATPSVVTMSDN